MTSNFGPRGPFIDGIGHTRGDTVPGIFPEYQIGPPPVPSVWLAGVTSGAVTGKPKDGWGSAPSWGLGRTVRIASAVSPSRACRRMRLPLAWVTQAATHLPETWNGPGSLGGLIRGVFGSHPGSHLHCPPT